MARRQADQIYNLSLTRTATVTLGRGADGVIGIGRVKTPTLAIACRREIEIRDFAPVGYFEVVATAHAEGGAFRMRHAPKERVPERWKAQAVLAAAREFEGPLGVRVEDRRQRLPRLHDLPSLQKLCSARFGWSASKTLEVAQELYDGTGKKILTYPRAEVRYLPESAIADVPKIVAGLRAGKSYAAIPAPAPPAIRKGRNGAFHDKGLEGASHHAMVPNVNTIGFLAAQGKNIVPTERGLALFGVLERADPGLVDPGVTAEMECLLDDVLTGRQEMMDAIDAVCDSARRIIGRLAARSDGGEALVPGEATSGGGTGRQRRQ